MYRRRENTEIYANSHHRLLPDMEDVRRINRARMLCATCVSDTWTWIERQFGSDPYRREVQVHDAIRMLAEFADSDDMELHINPMMRDEIESGLKSVCRTAIYDQVVEEQLYDEPAPDITPVTLPNGETTATITTTEYTYQRLVSDVADEVERRSRKCPAHTTHFLWPTYSPTASDDDKRTFEDTLTKLCTSKKRSMSRDIKNYLTAKTNDRIITRPTQINTEYEYVKLFGYPYAESTYYGA